MDETVRKISADDINPRYNWGRALPALGIMGVDFEERVDYRRLHRYRLSRVKQALENSELGALLVFDVNNIRYVTRRRSASGNATSCAGGRCSRATRSRSCGTSARPPCTTSSIPRGSSPKTARQGSSVCAARFNPAFGLMERHAKEIASLLKEAGVHKMPVGVDIIEPPMLFELEKAGLKINDGSR